MTAREPAPPSGPIEVTVPSVRFAGAPLPDHAHCDDVNARLRAEADHLRTLLDEALKGWRSSLGLVLHCDDQECTTCDESPDWRAVKRIEEMRSEGGLP